MRRLASSLSELAQLTSWLLRAAAIVLILVIIGVPVGAELPDSEADWKLHLAPLNPQFPTYLEEPASVPYGYIPPPFDLSHVEALAVSKVRLQALPARFDWREEGKVTSVKDQDPCGMCWAFGTASVLESAVLIGGGGTYDFSEQSVGLCVDPSWTYLYDAWDRPCHAGGNVFLASEVFIKKGAVLETCNPYDTSALQCDGECVCDSCPATKMVDGFRLVTADGSRIGAIKNAVYDEAPVTVSYLHDDAYLYSDPSYGTIYDYYPNSSDEPTHLVSIVGWDDDIPHPNPSHDGTGAWIIKNSWGTGWGDNDGYFYLAYDSSNCRNVAYLQYKNPKPDEELLYWDEAGMVTAVGYEHETAWTASVFTTPQDKAITHVDFWTTSSNAEYEIYVWDGSFGSQLAHQTGSCQELGYYSIPLSTAISVPADHNFTIGVRMTTPGFGYPIPVEYAISGVVNPPIQSDVSFIRHTAADSWADLADGGYNASLRVRMTDSDVTTPTATSTSTATNTPTSTATSTGTTTFPLPTPTDTPTPTSTSGSGTLTPTPTETSTADPYPLPSNTPTDGPIHHHLMLPLIVKGEHTAPPTPMPTFTPSSTATPEQEEWVPILAEDFEGSFPGDTWEVRDNDPDSGRYHWGERDCRAHGGSFSVWSVGAGDTPLGCGSDYPNNVYAWMLYGPFSLTDATAAELSFDWWSDTEYEYDAFGWYASTDAENYYGYEVTGDWASWTTGEVLDLADVPALGNLLGQDQVWIAFVFGSDSSITDKGAFLDNVLLRKRVGAAAVGDEASDAPRHVPQPNRRMEPAHLRLD